MSINVVLIDLPLTPSFPSYLEQSCAPSHSGRVPFDLDLHLALTYVASEPERWGVYQADHSESHLSSTPFL